jgi:hypothetical protein
MLWLGSLVMTGIAAALLLPPSALSQPSRSEPELSLSADDARDVCLRLSDNPIEFLTGDESQHRRELRTATCNKAFAAAP